MPKNKNEDVAWLKELKARAKEIATEQEEAITRIREGFVDRAVVFLDVVGSTQYKVNHKDTPEVWVVRVEQFSNLLAAAIEANNGRVVKYIGDEVMGVFDNIYDAQSLVARINEIEENLEAAIGVKTRIKVSADYGPVYLLQFHGHREPDPQGTTVDRCARIAKYGSPGVVLASQTFAGKTPSLSWSKLKTTELKGLGRQTIYQLGPPTISIDETIEVAKDAYEKTVDELDEMKTRLARAEEQNRQLQEQLRSAGQRPDPEGIVDAKDAVAAWSMVQKKLAALRESIRGAPGASGWLARFVFLHVSNNGGQEYNKFENKVFDELIEAGIVQDSGLGSGDDGYVLNTYNKLVQRILQNVQDVEEALAGYLENYAQDPEDLFEWSLADSGFWRTYMRWDVLNA